MLDFLSRIESEVRGYVRSFPTVFTSASGSWIVATDGKRYLDFFSGAGALNYGHNNPKINQAIIDYIAKDGIQHGLDMATAAKVRFLEKFDEFILRPRNLDYRIQFTGPTGTNAVEAALKLAKKSSGRSHVVAFTNAYHGHTLGSLAVTGNRYYHHGSYSSRNDVSHFPFDGYQGDLDTTELLAKMLADPSSGLPVPAAVIVETIQGEGGINVASTTWLQRLADICAAHQIALIVDDIQAGNGRTGTFFSFENSAIVPDMVCLSKSIGGGLPMSLLMIRPELDQWLPGEHTGTFRGNNLAFVAGAEALNYWKDHSFANHIREMGSLIQSRLNQLCEDTDGAVELRGRGMMWGLDTRVDGLGAKICAKCYEKGLIIESSGANDQVVKLLPPLTSTSSEISRGLSILCSAVFDCLVVSGTPSPLPIAMDTTPFSGVPNVSL